MSTSSHSLRRHISFKSATALVIANIIGAGIFTTTGFQASALGHPGYILALWVLGGILAFCGALCFGELGASIPRAGGEYVYLRETYGGVVGFMSAFVSLLAGFSAPIASAVKSFVRYLAHFFPALARDPKPAGIVSADDLIALAVVWLLILIHVRGARGRMRFNDAQKLLQNIHSLQPPKALCEFRP
jgi:APA family basic amino acid/polyamine antiporter